MNPEQNKFVQPSNIKAPLKWRKAIVNFSKQKHSQFFSLAGKKFFWIFIRILPEMRRVTKASRILSSENETKCDGIIVNDEFSRFSDQMIN